MIRFSNKKIIFAKLKRPLIASVLVITLITPLSAGCAKDPDEAPDNISNSTIMAPGTGLLYPEHIFLSELIDFPQLPEGLTTISNVVPAGDTVYFTAQGQGNAGNYRYGLFSMNINGTNLKELPNFIAGSALPDAFIAIKDLYIESDAHILLLESATIYDPELERINIFVTIRRLDKTGAEILSIDVSNLLIPESAFTSRLGFMTDISGNIYFLTGPTVHIFNDMGSLLFSLENPDADLFLIRMSTGIIALSSFNGFGIQLKLINVENKSWEGIINLPSGVRSTRNVFSGNDEFLFLYNDNSYLTGVLTNTGEAVNILNWYDSNLSPNNIERIDLLPDGRISVIKQTQSRTPSALPDTELFLLTAALIDDLPGKITLTLGTFFSDRNLGSVVEQFNRNSSTHQLKVIDYSELGSTHGLLKLSTEMIAGNAPDIISIANNQLPLDNYVPKGFLVDLYPLIDADPDLYRESFIASVLKMLETNGSLYRICSAFGFNTIIGSPAVLGSYPGWNMDEFFTVFKENPQADMPIGMQGSAMYFLSYVLTGCWDEFVDYASGTAYFDNDKFIDLLEMANTFPKEATAHNPDDMIEYINTGRQIMEMQFFTAIDYFLFMRTVFGGEIVLKGFPSENRNGNIFTPRTSIAITSSCTDINAAWEFIRMFLLEDYQREFIDRSFPVNNVVFNERLEAAMIPTGREIDPLTRKEADSFRSTIDNLTRIVGNASETLWMMVAESTDSFFNGQITAQDAARRLQSRATIYLSEQSG